MNIMNNLNQQISFGSIEKEIQERRIEEFFLIIKWLNFCAFSSRSKERCDALEILQSLNFNHISKSITKTLIEGCWKALSSYNHCTGYIK